MSVRNNLSMLALSAALAACGGNSATSVTTTTPTTNSAPVVSAGSDQTVNESVTVTLSATSSDADGDTLTLTWSQTSGTTVALSSTSTSSPTFTAPNTSTDETLVFQVTADDGTTTTTDEVSIFITDIALPTYAASFDVDSLVEAPSLVSCTLSDGAASTCMSVTLKSSPQNFNVGPWCPRNISDDASAGGIWLENGTDYEVDGAFISNLNTFYNDNTWQMYDTATGDITYTKTQTECSEAANPAVGAEYENYCVECQVSFIDEDLTNTYLIPISPVNASRSADVGRGSVGVGFSGIIFDASAPVDAILSAYTLAPFDDCGGHINLGTGYHVHAVTEAGCYETIDNTTGHAAQIGVAMDGYPLYERLNGTVEPTDLDSCRGHDTDQDLGIDGYHYHANEPGANAIIGCHTGQTAN